MPDFTPTEEQNEIVKAVVETSANLSVEARAGAAKTSTLILIAEAQPKKSILSLAFNAKIRDEMTERMPSNVSPKTLNGIGYQAWRQFIGKKTRVSKSKSYFLLREEIEALPTKPEKGEAWETFGDTLKAISAGKLQGYLGKGHSSAYKPLIDEADFYLSLPIVATDQQRELIETVTRKSWAQTVAGNLDFDDMILAPAVAGVSFDYYDIVLVDEAQDLSAINHVLLKKIVRHKSRLIAVGDPCQAIYGFRGAHNNSMKKLAAQFDCETHYLTVSFRCSQAVVENARWRAPDMKWADNAKPGLVVTPPDWNKSDLEAVSNVAVICRNNAPLFHQAIRLLRDGLYPEIVGRDIVKNIKINLGKLGKKTLKQEIALLNLAGWVEAQKLRVRDHRLVEDQADCMKIFLLESETLGDAIELVEHIGSQTGRIQLMTGHKAKGLEFDTVFFLDSHLITKEGQDPNIKYVIETRAKNNLVYVRSDDYADEVEVQTKAVS